MMSGSINRISETAGGSRPRRRALAVVLPVFLALTVSGCGSKTRSNGDIAFEGVAFKAKSQMVSKDARERFTVEVRKAAQSIDGAREAGRYEGVRYCIKNFGTSDIRWISGPDAEAQDLRFDKDSLLLEGACKI